MSSKINKAQNDSAKTTSILPQVRALCQDVKKNKAEKAQEVKKSSSTVGSKGKINPKVSAKVLGKFKLKTYSLFAI
jgi:hypothetical protein